MGNLKFSFFSVINFSCPVIKFSCSVINFSCPAIIAKLCKYSLACAFVLHRNFTPWFLKPWLFSTENNFFSFHFVEMSQLIFSFERHVKLNVHSTFSYYFRGVLNVLLHHGRWVRFVLTCHVDATGAWTGNQLRRFWRKTGGARVPDDVDV